MKEIKAVKLFDITGREISHFVRNDSNNTPCTIHLTSYSKGVYTVQVTTTKRNVYTEKLIVE